MSKLAWRLRRLRTMGAAEIVFRTRRAISARLERLSPVEAAPAPQDRFGLPWVAALDMSIDPTPYIAAGERTLAGRFDIYELEDAALGFPPQWNREPKSGLTLPLDFGKTIDYRDQARVGEIRYLWELNRHLELVTLAQAFCLTKERHFAEACVTLLESWIEQCSYPLGANWLSALEPSIRVINWSVAWHLLGGEKSIVFSGDAGVRFKRRWLDSVYRHSQFIVGHFSLHSSANNHLIGEYTGLFVAALTWPCWQESQRWLDRAYTGLIEEAEKQNGSDGVNREQAIWYHHEVADMMLLAGLAGRANAHEFPPQFWSRLEAMLVFIAAIMDARGHVPMIGDADDAVMVRFCPVADFDVFASLLATGAILFRRGDFKTKAPLLDDKTRWLLGSHSRTAWESIVSAPGDFPRAFPTGGYWVLGDKFDQPGEMRLVADAGSLGYLSIAAHGHADALALTLTVDGLEILVDPGTYGYATPARWRDAFRGTAGHNTVRIDGVDQSVSGGSFLWLQHARAWCEEYEDTSNCTVWVGAHDGYSRLRQPVLHRRRVLLNKPERTIRVADQLQCKGKHSAEIFWHFAEDCKVTLESDGVHVSNEGVALSLTMPACLAGPELRRGEEVAALGWISKKYGAKTPSATAFWRCKIEGTTELVTIIRVTGQCNGR